MRTEWLIIGYILLLLIGWWTLRTPRRRRRRGVSGQGISKEEYRQSQTTKKEDPR